MEHEMGMKKLELEIVKAKDNNSAPVKSAESETITPSFRIKLQPYDHKSKEDIITYLNDFENISEQAKWTDEMRLLQLRTLSGEAKDIALKAGKNYEE